MCTAYCAKWRKYPILKGDELVVLDNIIIEEDGGIRVLHILYKEAVNIIRGIKV